MIGNAGLAKRTAAIALAAALAFAGCSSSGDDSGTGPTPAVPADEIDLAQVTFLHQDVSGFPVTATVWGVTIAPQNETICISYDKYGSWPAAFAPPQKPVNATMWVVGRVNGQWYAATFEYLLVDELCSLEIENWPEGLGLQTKSQPLAGWAPARGEEVGFFVSTPARRADEVAGTTVHERSNVRLVRWP